MTKELTRRIEALLSSKTNTTQYGVIAKSHFGKKERSHLSSHLIPESHPSKEAIILPAEKKELLTKNKRVIGRLSITAGLVYFDLFLPPYGTKEIMSYTKTYDRSDLESFLKMTDMLNITEGVDRLIRKMK